MDSIKDHLYALIFCGGGGTRLWPLSREDTPKQFLKLVGDRSLLQDTYDRVKDFISDDKIFVITTDDYKKEVVRQLPSVPKENLLIEPARRNTAMAVGFGAAVIAKRDPDAIIANLWSDQLIKGKTLYLKALLAGAEAASTGEYLVTAGVEPVYPHTGMGYIKKGKTWGIAHTLDIFEVDRFTEKPDLDSAKKMVASGNYLWNIGLFIWRADSILKAYKIHSPDIYKLLVKISDSLGGRAAKETLLGSYNKAPEISVDYAIAEKSKNFLTIEAGFDWLDVGDFSVLWDISEKDKEGNAHLADGHPNWVGIETKQSLIVPYTKQLVGTVGVDNLVIVVTEDAVLVASKKSAQKVKALVEELKKTKKPYL